MPKVEIDYTQTIIYKICCKDTLITDIYVGSTTNFANRKNHHKYCCNTITAPQYNFNIYQFIRTNGGWNNWDIIEVEKYNAIDKLDQSKRERYWLEYFSATLNIQIPSRTIIEWTKQNKEHLNEYRKQYCEEHTEPISERRKDYYQENKEHINEKNKDYYQENKEHINEKKKDYYQENKEKITKTKKLYYNQNKNIILDKKKEKMTCECGTICRKGDISQHKKTQKHLAFTINAIHVGNTTCDIFLNELG
jgi:hypothetical protein